MGGDASLHDLQSPQALPLHRKLMIGTYSVINIYDRARDEEFCKICGCYCDNEDKIIIFTKTKTTEFYLPKLAWDQIEYPINIC